MTGAAAALSVAHQCVQRDLVSTGVWRPEIEDVLDTAAAHRGWWLEQWPDGAELVTCLLAQDVQEAMHEAFDRQWPSCPEHWDHPLFIEPDLGTDPFWVCARSGLPVSQVGSL